MLSSLTVRDIVLIERAELSFASGLNVLTGETGAGKSILLDALSLATGGKSSGRASLRPGAAQSSVVATFEVGSGHPALQLLLDNGIEGDDGAILMRRTVASDGRSRAFINDSAVGLSLAREIGARLVEVHGQSEDRGLFDASTHRRLLDAFGGHAALAEEVALRFMEVQAADKRLRELASRKDAAIAEAEYLAHAVFELRALAPKAGEEAELAETRALLMNGARLAQDLQAASENLNSDGGAEMRLAAALRRLSRLSPEGREAAAMAEAHLDSALQLVGEARRELESLLARLEGEPGKLEAVEERLFALRAAARKFAVPVDSLPRLAVDFEAKLALLDEGRGAVADAEAAAANARAAYRACADKLSAARATAAQALEAAVACELPPLKLSHVRFRVGLAALAEGELSAGGNERVQFEIATVEGASFGPLARIASGGELARISLALKVALAATSPPAVLIFDEVDRGVGGAVAAAVGERLQRLAQTTQVLLVTHSPQVAARASRHFRISRKGDATTVEMLDAQARREEIARMLSGSRLTDEARAAADRLIAEAIAAGARRRRARA